MRLRRIALALAALAACAASARSAPVPDSTAMSRLYGASNEWTRFRIVTGRGQFLVRSLSMDAEGVVVSEPEHRPALIATADAGRSETRRVTWSKVERIEGMRSHALRGAAAGAIAGALVGLGAKQAFEGELHDASAVAIVAIPIGALLGGVIGAAVGSTGGWHRLYP